MTYVILGIVLLVLVILFVLYCVRKKWAIRKVKMENEMEKVRTINKALHPFGFAFDLKQDIVVSINDSWQRDAGYSDFYDYHAPLLNIVTDAEPIYFTYHDKEYRLEFWKGQYGITTGAEIGLYVRDKHSKEPEGYYRSAHDEERLQMGFLLFHKCFLFSRCGFSWWLTGFDVGKFSKPKDLTMKVCISFPNQEMQIAFVEGLLQAGYEQNKIRVCGSCVCFDYCCSHHYKMNHRGRIWKCFAQICNRINVFLFNFFTRYFTTTLDKLTYIRFMFPCLYRFIIRFTFPRRRFKKCKKRRH